MHVWHLGWDSLKSGLSWDYGLGFLATWRQGARVLTQPGGGCMAAVSHTTFCGQKRVTATVPDSRGVLDSFADWGGHVA